MLKVLTGEVEASELLLFISAKTSKAVENNLTTAVLLAR
jgi:hypothetical protein